MIVWFFFQYISFISAIYLYFRCYFKENAFVHWFIWMNGISMKHYAFKLCPDDAIRYIRIFITNYNTQWCSNIFKLSNFYWHQQTKRCLESIFRFKLVSIGLNLIRHFWMIIFFELLCILSFVILATWSFIRYTLIGCSES